MTVRNKQKQKMLLYISVPVLLAAVLAFFCLIVYRKQDTPSSEQIVIAVPYSNWVQDYETNYYTAWLEQKTGYDITFVYLDEGYEKESLNTMLTSGNSNVDAVFLPENQEILSQEEYQDYIEDGFLADPLDYLSPDSNLARILKEYQEVDFGKLQGADGGFYCFPSLNLSRSSRNMQILWINIDWLTNLELAMPKTTEEFFEVLTAFQKNDPNRNGIADELPLVSCEADKTMQSYRYLLNAFTYYDGRKLAEQDKVGQGETEQSETEQGKAEQDKTEQSETEQSETEQGKAEQSETEPDKAEPGKAEQNALREGIAYCAMLYQKGLLAEDSFSYTKRQFMELLNDPADTVGAFTSHSIADVIYLNNPGILAHFVQLAPLSSEFLEKGYAVRAGIAPKMGGLIPSNAVHKEAAAQILDTMLEQEASLIALYGEENVDWRFSRDGELSTYGTRARVTTIRYLKGEKQNQNYAGAGPLIAAAENTDGVTWNGDHSMTEYLDARAVKTYEEYYRPATEKGTEETISDGARADMVSDYLEREILRFIRGERDVEKDADWEKFLSEYRRLFHT